MVCHEDSIRYLQMMESVDWIFIDPARRDGHGGKTIAISECEPDVSALENLLLEKASHVLVKLSPMLDLTLALHDLKHVQAAHVVSVNNECKELLLVLERGKELVPEEIPYSLHQPHCIAEGSKAPVHPPTGERTYMPVYSHIENILVRTQCIHPKSRSLPQRFIYI